MAFVRLYRGTLHHRMIYTGSPDQFTLSENGDLCLNDERDVNKAIQEKNINKENVILFNLTK